MLSVEAQGTGLHSELAPDEVVSLYRSGSTITTSQFGLKFQLELWSCNIHVLPNSPDNYCNVVTSLFPAFRTASDRSLCGGLASRL